MSVKRFFLILISLLISLSFLRTFSTASSADIRTGDKLTVSERLENAYMIGGNITSDSTVSGDLTTAGGNLILRGSTTGSVNAAGGDIAIDTQVGNTLRVAGGNITISGPVNKDVVIAGGNITIAKTASIGGDLLFAGGTLKVEGPIKGKILMAGGTVILSGVVDGDVEGNVGTLMIEDGAEIKGDVEYTSSQRAIKKDGAIIRGQETFHAEEKNNQQLVSSIFKTTILKLITDILFALLLVYLFPGVLRRIIQLATSQKVRSGLTGLGILFLGPVVSLFLLFILWLGISSWLLYFLLLVLALMIGKFILGWWALKWWYGREKKEYVLDWKVAIVGPALTALLAFIPVLGWIILAALYLISLGALALSAYNLRKLK